MNVLQALLIVALSGAVAGVAHGVILYGGVVLPGRLKDKKIPQGDGTSLSVTLFVPGVFGHILIGAIGGVLVFCYEHNELAFSTAAKYAPTLGDISFALVIGLTGSVGLNLWMDRKDLLGLKVQDPGNGATPDVNDYQVPDSDMAYVARAIASDQQRVAGVLHDVGVPVVVMPTPRAGIFTNHSFDLYRSLPSV